jgi:hypothetical protein
MGLRMRMLMKGIKGMLRSRGNTTAISSCEYKMVGNKMVERVGPLKNWIPHVTTLQQLQVQNAPESCRNIHFLSPATLWGEAYKDYIHCRELVNRILN